MLKPLTICTLFTLILFLFPAHLHSQFNPANATSQGHIWHSERQECGVATSVVGNDTLAVLIGGRGVKQTLVMNLDTSASAGMGYIGVNRASVPVEMHHFQAQTYQDSLIVIAGALTASLGVWYDEPPLNQIYLYNAITDSYQSIDLTQVPNSRIAGSRQSILVGDWLYLFNGVLRGHYNPGPNDHTSWVDRINLASSTPANPAGYTWERLPNTPRPRDHATAVRDGDFVYLGFGRNTSIGGGNYPAGMHNPVMDMDVFHIPTQVWATVPMSGSPTPRGGHSAALLNCSITGKKEIHYWGGEWSTNGQPNGQADALDDSWKFEIGVNNWQAGTFLNGKTHGTAVFLHQNKVFHLAGNGGQGNGDWNRDDNEWLRIWDFCDAFEPVTFISLQGYQVGSQAELHLLVEQQGTESYELSRYNWQSGMWEVRSQYPAKLENGICSYTFVDHLTESGTYDYRVIGIDFDGTLSYSRVQSVTVNIESPFKVPFTTVLPENRFINFSGKITEAKALNLLGTYTNLQVQPGQIAIPASLPAGQYWLRLKDEAGRIHLSRFQIR